MSNLFDGNYNSLTNKPTLGTAAAENVGAFAPASEGVTLGASSTTTVGIVTVNTRQVIVNGVTLTVLVV